MFKIGDRVIVRDGSGNDGQRGVVVHIKEEVNKCVVRLDVLGVGWGDHRWGASCWWADFRNLINELDEASEYEAMDA